MSVSTRQDASYPLPRIEDILDQLGDAEYYSTMDLESGYYQVLVNEKDRKKTAFSTPYGHYEFPATIQRMMNHALIGLHGIECLIYLDDIVVYGRTLEEDNRRLVKILNRRTGPNLP